VLYRQKPFILPSRSDFFEPQTVETIVKEVENTVNFVEDKEKRKIQSFRVRLGLIHKGEEMFSLLNEKSSFPFKGIKEGLTSKLSSEEKQILSPLRNRRIFYSFLTFLVFVCLLVFFLGGRTFLEYRSKTSRVKVLIAKTDQLIRNVERDEKKFSAGIQNAIKGYKSKVDRVNSIILKKSFSWIEFFSDLETSLPDSSYIVSLAPTLTEDSKMQVRFKVASSDLNDLIKLLDNLNALEFDQIRIIGEGENETGTLISEISLYYERDN
jgi:cell division protein FtsB